MIPAIALAIRDKLCLKCGVAMDLREAYVGSGWCFLCDPIVHPKKRRKNEVDA